MTTPQPAPRRGRTRDREIDPRLLAAAREIYGETGWSGFTMDAVARRANVGRAALYLRWPTKEKLLVDTFASAHVKPGRYDSGSVRTDLLDLAQQIFDQIGSPGGRAELRLRLERGLLPEELAACDRENRRQAASDGQSIINRAVARGELPESASATLVLNLVVGGVYSYVVTLPASHRACLPKTKPDFLERLVDVVIAGVKNATTDR